MSFKCSGFIVPSVGFGSNCAVCGYPQSHKTHAPPDRTPSNTTRSTSSSRPQNAKATRSTAKTTTITSTMVRRPPPAATRNHNRRETVDMDSVQSEPYEEEIDDDEEEDTTTTNTHRSGADETASHASLTFTSTTGAKTAGRRGERQHDRHHHSHSHGKTTAGGAKGKPEDKKNARTLSATLERQCNLHTLAADAARHVGRDDKAFEHYEEAVTYAERLEKARKKKEAAERKQAHTHTHHRRRSHQATWAAGEGRADRHRHQSGRQSQTTAPWAVDEPPAKVEREWGAAATLHVSRKGGGGIVKGHGVDYLDRDRVDGRQGSHMVRNDPKSLLETCGYDEEIQSRLKELFRKYSRGAPGLSKQGFEDLLESVGCPGDVWQYWAAFDREKKRSWIGAAEFVLGCAACDPLTPHTGKWRAERAKYLFRYYARGHSTVSLEQLAEMGEHLEYIADSQGLAAEVMSVVGGDGRDMRKGVSIKDFVHMVADNKIRGTSRLLRFSFLDHMDI
eukprot:m.95194 g.95194  ORF g.95194 m.95194 type:complete len:506 (+) comp10092_c0_seq1:79-1596(+)